MQFSCLKVIFLQKLWRNRDCNLLGYVLIITRGCGRCVSALQLEAGGLFIAISIFLTILAGQRYSLFGPPFAVCLSEHRRLLIDSFHKLLAFRFMPQAEGILIRTYL
jgi:hypothetical protein